ALIARLEAAEAKDAWIHAPDVHLALFGSSLGKAAKCPAYTISLDAALALAERVLPEETFWEMSHNAVINGQRMYHADVFPPEQSGEATFWGYGPHPALALVIAILRAKQGEGG